MIVNGDDLDEEKSELKHFLSSKSEKPVLRKSGATQDILALIGSEMKTEMAGAEREYESDCIQSYIYQYSIIYNLLNR